ncbi:MAG: ATP synthase F0 subunit A [Planctomycetaceae bacterium]|nr:ATP synthase F0 subunit A [Planctomycetaceae bacterium]
MQPCWSLTLGADSEHLMGHVLPHKVFGTEWLTNHMLMALVAAVLVLLAFSVLASRIRPRGSGVDAYITKGRVSQIFEVICEYLRSEIVRPTLGKLTDKYIYYVWTVFFFVVFCNLLGMVPFGAILGFIDGIVTGDWHQAANTTAHIGGTATSNLGVTGPLAVLSLIMIVGVGIREQGIAYFKHFCPVPLTPWPMVFIAVPLVFLEVLGLFIKCVVLAMRLFGNMVAGHLVIAAMIGIITGVKVLAAGIAVGAVVMLGATAISLLELFVAFLQAFIFTFLTVLFIAAGAVHHDEQEHDHVEAAAEH